MSMSEIETTKDFALTEAQEKEVKEAFSYTDQYEMTEEDFVRLGEMFKSPEDFKLLRKVLGIHTPNEAGMTFKSPHKLIEASVTDLQAYGIESAVSNLADERIRQALLHTYVRLRGFKQKEMTENFEAKNQADFEEGKRTEEFEEKQDEDKRTVGVNL